MESGGGACCSLVGVAAAEDGFGTIFFVSGFAGGTVFEGDVVAFVAVGGDAEEDDDSSSSSSVGTGPCFLINI